MSDPATFTCDYILMDNTVCGRKPRHVVAIYELELGTKRDLPRCHLHDHSPALRELQSKGHCQIIPFYLYVA